MADDSQSYERESGEQPRWARPISRHELLGIASEATVANVEGRRVTGPRQGFGQIWEKTYEARLCDTGKTAADVFTEWRSNFASLWPAGNRFYVSPEGIAPGSVGVINLKGPAGMPVYTAIRVSGLTDHSWTFTTVQGHMFAGVITFTVRETGPNCISASVQATISASDPLWEVSMLMFGFRREDAFWASHLGALAKHLGVQVQPVTTVKRIDRRRHWSRALNVRRNAALGSAMHLAIRPFRRRSAAS